MIMKALHYLGPKSLQLVELEVPEISSNEVLMKMKKVGICGTDLHIYQGGMNVPTPLVMGHEFVGDIVKIGSNVKRIKVGDKAVAEHVVGCGQCNYCKQGMKNLCLTPTVIGVHKSGALAEYMVLPEDLVFSLPKELSYDDGVLIEPLSIAVYAVDKANVKADNTVAVLGQGPIGIFVDQVAKAYDAKVFGFDINNDRLGHALEAGYLNAAFNTKDEKFMDQFRETLNSDGADVVFEVVGRDETAQMSLDLARRGGKVVVLGVFEHDVPINMMQLVRKELQVFGSWTCLNTFEETINLVKDKKINTNGLITHRYKFTDSLQAFEDASKTNQNRIKSVIEFD